ncbi:MAG: hypothetical protein AAFQ64_18780 [Pseudomonadota bacterium]
MTKSYSRPAERLGACLALLMNQEADPGRVKIQPFALWQRLVNLTKRNSTYRGPLLGLGGEDEDGAEQRAVAWIDLVLDGPRQIHAGRQFHNGHLLLERLADRYSKFSPARLSRSVELRSGSVSDNVTSLQDRLLLWAAERNTTSNSDGLVHLAVADGSQIAVPEPLSLWGAIKCAEADVDRLDSERELEFVHFMARAVHGANKHWEMLVALALHPPDWIETDGSDDGPLTRLTTNQARLAVKLKRRAHSVACDGAVPTVAAWRDAWDAEPITRSLNFDRFVCTPVGRHLMAGHSGPVLTNLPDLDRDKTQEPEDRAVASLEEARAALSTLRRSGKVPEADLDLVQAILDGEDLTGYYAAQPALAQLFPTLTAFLDHSDKVARRIADAVEQLDL